MPEPTHVVTCFLRHEADVLLLRRSAEVGSYPGQWGAVAGHAEGDPDAAARQEIAEETGLDDAVTLVRAGASFDVEDAERGTRWRVHPYLFDCAHRDVTLNWESDEAAWVRPPEILRRNTVPQLWTSYTCVAPTVESVADDATHGAAYLSIRALEVLRDRAAALAAGAAQAGAEGPKGLVDTARALLDARPSMAVLRNRVNHVMHRAQPDLAAADVTRIADEALTEALQADAAAATGAAAQIAGKQILTLSRSGTVLAALRQADPPARVVVAASQPGGEGIDVAETLAAAGLDVTLIPDAALAAVFEHATIDAVLVGADTVLADGAVVNKTGTRLAALAARQVGVPCFAVAATDKISPFETTDLEEGRAAALYQGTQPVQVYHPLFERTPADLFAAVLTETGALSKKAIRAQADTRRAWTNWDGA